MRKYRTGEIDTAMDALGFPGITFESLNTTHLYILHQHWWMNWILEPHCIKCDMDHSSTQYLDSKQMTKQDSSTRGIITKFSLANILTHSMSKKTCSGRHNFANLLIIQHKIETCISLVKGHSLNKYLKLTDTRITPSHPLWTGWIFQFPRCSKSNFNGSDKTLCKQVIELRPEASHEVKINLHTFEYHDKKYKQNSSTKGQSARPTRAQKYV